MLFNKNIFVVVLTSQKNFLTLRINTWIGMVSGWTVAEVVFDH